MPLYEYRCTACGYKFEKIQKFSDQPDTVCPKCQGELVRPMTAPALRFEGAGWYVNDYAGKGGAKSGDAPAASADSAATDSGAKDAKPASGGDSPSTSAAPAAASAPASKSAPAAPSTAS